MEETSKISHPFFPDISCNLNNTETLDQYSPFSILSIIDLAKTMNEKIKKPKNKNKNNNYNKSDKDFNLTNHLQCNIIKKANKFPIDLNEKKDEKFRKYVATRSEEKCGELSPLPKLNSKKNNCENKPTKLIKKFDYSPLNNNILSSMSIISNYDYIDKNKYSNSLSTLKQSHKNNTLIQEDNKIFKGINTKNIVDRNLNNFKRFISNNDIRSNTNDSQNMDNSLYIGSKKDLNIKSRNLRNLKYNQNDKKLINFALYPLLKEVEIKTKYHMVENIKKSNKIFNLFSNSSNRNNLICSNTLSTDVIQGIPFKNNNKNTENIHEVTEFKKQQNTVNNICNSVRKKSCKNIIFDYKCDTNKKINLNKTISKKKIYSRNFRNTFHIKIKEIPRIFPLTQVNNIHNNYNSQEYVIEKYFSKEIIPYQKCTLPPLIGGQASEKFYYTINKMYRKQLSEYMMHRINWEFMDTKSKFFLENKNININFQWRYYSNRINFKNYKFDNGIPTRKLKMVNLFERNYEIGNKRNMFINFINYCDKVNLNAFQYVPLTITITNTKDVDNYLDSLKDLMNFVESKKDSKTNLISNKKYNELFWFDKNYESINNQYIYIDKNYLS